MGWEPGEAAQRRAECEARRAEYKRQEEERRANLTEEDREAEDAAKARDHAKWERKWESAFKRRWANKNQNAYFAGRREADEIGLDDQVSKTAQAALK